MKKKPNISLFINCNTIQRDIVHDQYCRGIFFSKTPMEDIDAINKSVSSIINSATNEVAVQMSITNFVFLNKLMQEHFNENSLESEKFPSATFKGKIKESVNLTVRGTYAIEALGSATIHGITRPIELKGSIVSTGNTLSLSCQFEIKLVDYQIKIPKIVFAKIAEVIKVSSTLSYSKK
jgi:polyisoprenoid-binding protein YceI